LHITPLALTDCVYKLSQLLRAVRSSFSAPTGPLNSSLSFFGLGVAPRGRRIALVGLPLSGPPGRSSRRPPRLSGSGGQLPYPLQAVLQGFISLSL